MCDELLRCFRRRSAKVESFWPGAEPASLPRGCSLIQTCCMHPHARRTHILSHALKHPSPTPSHASSSDHLVFQTTYCTSSCELISCAEPLPPFLLILRRRLLGLWEVGRDRLPFLRMWPALLYIPWLSTNLMKRWHQETGCWATNILVGWVLLPYTWLQNTSSEYTVSLPQTSTKSPDFSLKISGFATTNMSARSPDF